MKILLSFIFVALTSLFFAQEKAKEEPKRNSDYFLRTDSLAGASPFSFKYMYAYQIPNGFFRTGGTSFEFGINFARFFTDKMIIGLGTELKYLEYQGAQSISQETRDKFNANYTPDWTNRFDSIRSATLHGAINDIDGNYVLGTRFLNYSINFSPFPHKYGGFLLQYKSGKSEYSLAGPSSAYYDGKGKARMTFKQVRDQSLELSFHPYKFFGGPRVRLRDIKVTNLYKTLVVSLYGKRTSLNNSFYGGNPLSKYVKQEFIDQYKSVYSFGIKVGLGIW